MMPAEGLTTVRCLAMAREDQSRRERDSSVRIMDSDLCSDDDEPGGQLLGESTTGEGGNDDEEDDDDDDDDGAEGVKDGGGQRPSGGGGGEKKKKTSAISPLHVGPLFTNPLAFQRTGSLDGFALTAPNEIYSHFTPPTVFYRL